MGFQRSQLRLKFMDPEFEGLEVTCRRMKIGLYAEVLALTATVGKREEGATADPAEVDRVVTLLAEHLVAWNLEDEEGQPVPATLAGVRDQDLGLLVTILNAWMDVAISVAPPLPRPSDDGARSAAGSIPMETLSPALLS